MEAVKTHDPSKSFPGWEYEPYYEDQEQEAERLERCLQQQIENLFTTISRIQKITEDKQRWQTLRGGLRCWRAAIRVI